MWPRVTRSQTKMTCISYIKLGESYDALARSVDVVGNSYYAQSTTCAHASHRSASTHYEFNTAKSTSTSSPRSQPIMRSRVGEPMITLWLPCLKTKCSCSSMAATAGMCNC